MFMQNKGKKMVIEIFLRIAYVRSDTPDLAQGGDFCAGTLSEATPANASSKEYLPLHRKTKFSFDAFAGSEVTINCGDLAPTLWTTEGVEYARSSPLRLGIIGVYPLSIDWSGAYSWPLEISFWNVNDSNKEKRCP